MKDFFRHSSTWALLFFFITLLDLSTLSYAQDSTYSTDSSDAASENAAGAAGSESSMIGPKSHDVIIILSVIVGIAVILGVSSAILFLIAKRRQWAVREAMRRSTRRVADAIKSPLTPRFPKSPRDAPPAARSRQGTTRIETAPSQPKHTDSKSGYTASFNQKTRSGRGRNESRKERELDLERGIELGATKTSSVRVSTKESSISHDSESNVPTRGWGTFFPFGRH
ncbi:hypothetical protein VTN77DRAFT_6437 [Rasamsonia byssochlamydoides]|uniref:uncharacterized protein n=1 Tax=Rasamsonia byssochlamydoides TaxID=89139 RepID=UPI003742B719